MEDTRFCHWCGREIAGEWVPFPPALQKKYDREGELWFPPCTSECEKKNDLREWELDVRARRVAELLKKSHMPERLARSTLSGFEHWFSPAAKKGLDAVERFVRDWEKNREAGRGLYLCGGVGTGKTHLVSGAARELIHCEGVPTLFHTAPELLDRLRPSAGSDDREAWASAAMTAELLVLDDLGAETATEWAKERIFVLVNHRYRANLPTVYTSNIGPKGLAGHLGDRTASRIIETCEFVLMDGPDHRVESRRKS